jgi:uncharacterized protein
MTRLGPRREALLRAGIFWVGFFACLRFTGLLVGSLGLNGADRHGNVSQWAGGVLMTVLTLLWTRVCLLMEKGRPVETGTRLVRGSIPRTLLGLVLAIPLSAISLLSLKWLVPGVQFVRVGSALLPVLTAAALSLLLATYEEVGFRGYPMRRLLQAFGVWPTLFIVAIAFVLYHISMGWELVPALLGTGVGSLLFGMAAIAARRGLAFPIGVHAGWNIATWSLNEGAGIWKMTVPSQLAHRVQVTGFAVYVACMFFGIALLKLWRKRDRVVE